MAAAAASLAFKDRFAVRCLAGGLREQCSSRHGQGQYTDCPHIAIHITSSAHFRNNGTRTDPAEPLPLSSTTIRRRAGWAGLGMVLSHDQPGSERLLQLLVGKA